MSRAIKLSVMLVLILSLTPLTKANSSLAVLNNAELSYQYSKTYGETDVAYFPNTSYINYPWGIGTDGTNVWIGESRGNRALKYNGSGVFEMQIGTAGKISTISRDLMGISDITVDHSGNIWVVDDPAFHVVKYSPSGSHLAELGSVWISGSDNNHFGTVQIIAFDSANNIYVSDGAPWYNQWGGNHRIQIFTSAGNYLATIGQTGICGAGSNQFCGPRHITIFGDELFVSDASNYRVQIFDISTPTSPTYKATIGVSGVKGSDSAHFDRPSGVTADANYK